MPLFFSEDIRLRLYLYANKADRFNESTMLLDQE